MTKSGLQETVFIKFLQILGYYFEIGKVLEVQRVDKSINPESMRVNFIQDL